MESLRREGRAMAAALVVCLVSLFGAAYATQATERTANAVQLTFYQMSEAEWTNALTNFETLLAAEAVTYCTTNYAACGLDSSSGFLFVASGVGVSTGPTIESKSLQVSVYQDLPTIKTLASTPITSFVLNSAALTTILTNMRESLENSLGFQIPYIASEFYGIDPDALNNKIIIPCAFVILFAVIGVAIGLHNWNKQKEEAERKKLLKERRNKKGRVKPMVTTENEKMVNNLYGANGTTDKGKVETTQVPHVIYEERVSVKSGQLPPLPGTEEAKAQMAAAAAHSKDEDRERRERRRRRKEKRRAEKEAAGEEYKSGMESEGGSLAGVSGNIVPVEEEGPELEVTA